MNPDPPPERAPITRALARVVPGIGRVSAQIEPYAAAWRVDTATALAATGPLLGVLGDSTAQGIGASSHLHGWVGQLHDWLVDHTGQDWTVANWSRSGARVADVLDRQLPELLAADRAPHLTVMAVGSNDVFWGLRTGAARRGFRELIPLLPAPTVMAVVPAQGLAVRAKLLNRLIEEVAGQHEVVTADVNRTIGFGRGRLASDGFHPSDRGYAEWVDAFRPAVEAVLVHRR